MGRRLTKAHYAPQAYMHIYSKSVELEELKNKELTIVIPAIDPPYINYVNFTDAEAKERGHGPGVVIEILKDIRDLLNLTYNVVPLACEDILNTTGTWTDAFDQLAEEKVDLIAGAAIMQYDRSLISDLTYPFHYDTTIMVMKRPDKPHYDKFLIITAPFRWEVWLTTILSIIASGFIFLVINRLIGRIYNEQSVSVFESFWIFISIVLQQGLQDQPRSCCCRIMIGFWWLASLTLMATFTGSLVAIFATENRNSPFHDLSGLVKAVKQGKYTVVMDLNSPSRRDMIAKSDNTLYKELWHEMQVNKKVLYINGTYPAIEFVRSSPGYVFLGSKETITYYSSFGCDLLVINDDLLPVYLSIPLVKDSKYSVVFSNRIREMVERGFSEKWIQDYKSYAATKGLHACNSSTTIDQTSNNVYLDLNRTQGAFWILIGGLVGGIVLVAIEYLGSKVIWKKKLS